jgi:uridine phosphorylase
MYRELSAEDHRRVLGLTEAELPDVLLLLGVFDIAGGAERFSTYIEGPRWHRRFTSWLGTYNGLKVGLAAAFGGPMAAVHAHTWLAAGVPAVAQLGWFGALQHGSDLGDVVVPRHAERQDGVSDWYLPKGILADASVDLAAGVRAELDRRGVPNDAHAIYSTPALLAESRDVIADWSRHGYFGVDMETAATFAVGKSLNAMRVAALIRLDDLVAEEDSIADAMPRERRAALRAREPEVTHAVLDALIAIREGMAERV